MNNMQEIAQLLGVKLGEEFYMTNSDDVFKITMDGFMVKACNGVWRKYITAFYHLMIGDEQIIKLPKQSKYILTDKEKYDLSGVIKPWKNRINTIGKVDCETWDGERERILITYEEEYKTDRICYIELPTFKKGTMYKGMEFEKKYTLEELVL